MIDGLLAVRWVTGAIGNEHSVKVMSYLVNRIVKWEASDRSTPTDKAAQDVLLDSAIY
jgi:hypothetical protein